MERFTISDSERQLLENSVQSDRPKLFDLADKVLVRAPERQWDVVVSDAVRGILVGRFLSQILTADAQKQGRTAPGLVHIANSRHAYAGVLYNGFCEPSRGHTQVITNYLTPLQYERALIATDMVDTGKCLRKLGAAARRADMSTDFAILASPHQPQQLRRKMHAPRSSELYVVHSGVEPMLAQDTITQGLGVRTEYGIAEPQPSPYAWEWIGEVAYQLYDQLAIDYVEARP